MESAWPRIGKLIDAMVWPSEVEKQDYITRTKTMMLDLTGELFDEANTDKTAAQFLPMAMMYLRSQKRKREKNQKFGPVTK